MRVELNRNADTIKLKIQKLEKEINTLEEKKRDILTFQKLKKRKRELENELNPILGFIQKLKKLGGF